MHNHGLYLTQNLNKHDESSERNLNTRVTVAELYKTNVPFIRKSHQK